jgi:hypothetical protein
VGHVTHQPQSNSLKLLITAIVFAVVAGCGISQPVAPAPVGLQSHIGNTVNLVGTFGGPGMQADYVMVIRAAMSYGMALPFPSKAFLDFTLATLFRTIR